MPVVLSIPCRSESGGGAGGDFSCRHLVFASELAPLHRAPCPLLVFAGRIRRSLQRIPRSPLRANSPARRPSLSCRRTSRRPRVLRVRSSTDRTPFLASSPARWRALSCRCTRVVSTPRGLRFSTIRTPFLAGVLSRVNARELCRHFVASVFRPAGCHFSPACWRALVLVHTSCVGTSRPLVLDLDLSEATSCQLNNLLVHPLMPTTSCWHSSPCVPGLQRDGRCASSLALSCIDMHRFLHACSAHIDVHCSSHARSAHITVSNGT
jgi:hypothetical protein